MPDKNQRSNIVFNDKLGLKYVSFYCRGFESTLYEIVILFDNILLQKHWLHKQDLDKINEVHSDLRGVSHMDACDGL